VNKDVDEEKGIETGVKDRNQTLKKDREKENQS